MTRDDALTIVGMVAAHWPGNWATTEALDAYARAIEPLEAEVTMKAVIRCVNEMEFYPKVSVLREYVKMEKRQQEYARAKEEAVEAQRMTGRAPTPRLPDWVCGWSISRYRYRDFRTWPAQDPQGFSDDPMPKDDQERYTLEGRGLTIEMLFRPLGIEV